MREGTPSGFVFVYCNWCEIDTLDGKDLQDGEKLRLTWPDKSEQDVRIKVEKRSRQEQDMFQMVSVPVSKAYIDTKYRGKPIRIYIAGLPAKRI